MRVLVIVASLLGHVFADRALSPPRTYGVVGLRQQQRQQQRGFGGPQEAVTKTRGGNSEHASSLSGFELAACIVADLCPHGMLPLAWAASSGGGTGAVPSLALLALFGGVGSYTLYLSAALGELAPGDKSTALSSIWKGAGLPAPKAVDALVATLCAGCCIFYAAFAADLTTALLPRLGRPLALASLGAVVAPLCLGDDLSVLKYSSYAGLVGVFYTAGLLGYRGLKAAVPKQPVGLFKMSSGTAVLANTLVVAYLCHYNAIQYYRELKGVSKTPKAFGKVALAAATVTATVFATMLFGGRAAFGAQAMPNVLNNLSNDLPSTLAKLGTAVAIVSGFPLMFAGLKASLDGAVTMEKATRKRVLASLLVSFGAVASVTTDEDIGLVIELLGSTLGCAAVYIVPGLSAWAGSALVPGPHKVAGAILTIAGFGLGIFGTTVTLKSHFAHAH